jgi:hypothetical protein
MDGVAEPDYSLSQKMVTGRDGNGALVKSRVRVPRASRRRESEDPTQHFRSGARSRDLGRAP